MPKVTLGDGRSLTVGDEFLKLSPAEQQSWVNEVAASLPPPKDNRSVAQRAEGLYRAADEGAVRGVAGLVGLPGLLTDLGKAGLRKIGVDVPASDPSENILPRPEDIEHKIRQGPLYQGAEPYRPQGAGEEYAQTIGEFLPGALLTGGVGSAAPNTARAVATHLGTKVAPRVAAETLLPAVASETAGRLTKDSGLEPYARFAGALVGGGASALATRPRTAEAVLQGSVGRLTRQQIDNATRLIEDAASGPNPVRLTWPEAISQVTGRPVLSDTMRHLEASPQSADQLAEFFAARPGEVAARVGAEAENLAPGARPRPSSVGPTAGQAAVEAVEAVRGDINRATAPLYAAGEGTLLSPIEMQHIRASIPEFETAAVAVRNNRQLQRNVAHLPDNSVGFIDAVKQHVQQMANTERAGIQPGTGHAAVAAGLETDAANLRNIVNLVSTNRAGGETAQALATQAARREAEVTPLLQGPLGRLADKDISTKNAITALFPKDPDVGSAVEIADAVTRMAQQHPRAAADLVRAHVERAFNQARTDLQGGPSQAAGARLRKDIFGNPQQRENLQAAVVAALPDGAVRFRGFDRLMDILEATGTRQGIGSKTAYNLHTDQILGQAGIVNNAAKAVGSFPTKPLAFLTDKYQQFKLGQNKNELARILIDPNSAQLLRSLAETNPGSQRALMLATKLLNYGAAAQSHSENREALRRVYITKP